MDFALAQERDKVCIMHAIVPLTQHTTIVDSGKNWAGSDGKLDTQHT